MYGYEGTEDTDTVIDRVIKVVLVVTMLIMVALCLYSIKANQA